MKCPKCNTFNDADRYEKKMTTSSMGTFKFHCRNQRCEHSYTQVVDEMAEIRERESAKKAALIIALNRMEKTEC